ncbi:anaphase-promoting complex subunit 6 [Aplysia californica]|uniref:Anaphase-promoting complex subunit 6 n=1 Tax=Aplysia californica TaxID=6500 RepID=A0ABM1W4K0_APLCA|nr:anaphase-promoting complex subunit 6 [Aplysia californica]XP_035829593.1 anaphase-promoting complex subunit 6 [Aplysia californica]XP_035829594.1 anaphase-promoting complex subunit 6 [Aplysia californica]XP_035829595.1 anaphase-promoting complex subunit 6 [Aplysia californica]XP_035829596.1 anaphase-promoting complex subunit 6 [Aplysia californica]XP_035829597.1 anaphase-promoting complex subunit 6 [Aplysia californica]
MFVSASQSFGAADCGVQRRPSFPQGGLDWRLRHKRASGPGREGRKFNSVCDLSENDDDDDDDNDDDLDERSGSEVMPFQHDRACPLHRVTAPPAGATTAPNPTGQTQHPGLYTANVTSQTSLVTSQSPSLSVNSSPSPAPQHENAPRCSCIDRRNSRSAKNNNNNEEGNPSGHNRDGVDGGGGHRGRRKKARETVIINVGGQVFETYRSTLRRLKTPIFNSDDKLQRYYRSSHKDYFFDRDATAFGSILNFLRTGELHIPTNMCGPALQVGILIHIGTMI